MTTPPVAPLPSFTSGDLAARKIRLVHHVRLLLGLTPILAMLALGPEATLLRILLVFAVLASLADVALNLWLRRGAAVWAELPQVLDVGVPTSVRVRVALPHGLGALGRFVYGVDSGPKVWSDRLVDGEVPVVAERRGRLESVTFEVETGGVFHHVHTVLGFVLAPTRPILVVPAAVRDDAGRAVLDRFDAAATAELDVVGVRPWRDGDQRRDVHWAATARVGDVIVADRLPEPDTTRRLEIVAVADRESTLRDVLGRARHLAEHALAQGWTVDLVTRVGSLGAGVAVTTVGDEPTLFGALADAVTGAPIAAAELAEPTAPRLVVEADGTKAHAHRERS